MSAGLGRAAAAVGLVAVLAVAISTRLAGIGVDTDIADEGIRGLQLRLMAAGYHPVRQIYAAQGPLSLVLFYPLYELFGADIVAARMTPVFLSILGLAAAAGIGWHLGGWTGALFAAGLLTASPIYLENSRLALVEIPSLAPTMVAMLALLQYRRRARRRWLAVSASLLAVAVLTKPMAIIAAASATVLLVWPASAVGWSESLRCSVRRLALYGAIVCAISAAVIVWAGPDALYEYFFEYRVSARAVGEWSLAENWNLVARELGRESVGSLLLAGVGAIIAIRRRPAATGGLLVWLLLGLLVVSLYSPLRPKHLVYLVPPFAVLGGVAAASAVRSLIWMSRGQRSGLGGVVAVCTLAVYLVGGPDLVEQSRRIIERPAADDIKRFAADIEVIDAVTRPNDYIVMDDAYLAMLTGRLTPPPMADLSYTRIRSRTLSSNDAKALSEAYAVRAIVMQDDHLGQLPRYVDWVDRTFVLVNSYVQRAPNRFRRVYLRSDANLEVARAVLSRRLDERSSARIGPVALLGYRLEQRDVKPGETLDVAVHWEALSDTPGRHNVVVRLRGADGRLVQERRLPVGDGDQQLHQWRDGQWQFQTLRVGVDRRTRPNTYTATLAVRDAEGNDQQIVAAAGVQLLDGERELVLGSIRVRP